MQPSAANTSYQVESPAALASAPPTTCPWVRVGRDGTTMVRNYMNMPPLAVEPVAVQEIIYSAGWQPTPAGARLGQQAILSYGDPLDPRSRGVRRAGPGRLPLRPADRRARARRPGARRDDNHGSETAASLAGTIAIAGATLEIGAGVPAGAAGRVLEQGSPPVITVRIHSGGQIAAVTLLPGFETQVVVGQPPSTPAPIGTHAAMAIAQAMSTRAQSQANDSRPGRTRRSCRTPSATASWPPFRRLPTRTTAPSRRRRSRPRPCRRRRPRARPLLRRRRRPRRPRPRHPRRRTAAASPP